MNSSLNSHVYWDTLYFFTIKFLHEGTVDVSEPSFKDIYRRFTTVSLKSLSDYIDERNILVFYLKIEYFRCGFSVIVTLPLLKLEQFYDEFLIVTQIKV